MIHLEKVNSLRPSILNLFRKAHISPVRFNIRLENKSPSANTGLTEINTLNSFRTHKYDFVANILSQYVNTKFIPWDEVTKKVVDKQIEEKSGQDKLTTVYSMILETCEDLKHDTIGISYCEYLVNENKNLSSFNLFLIMRLLHTCGEKVAEHKELLKILLDKIKPYLSQSFAYAGLCATVLCHDYDCWKNLLDSYPSLKDIPDDVLSILATEAFKFNEYEMGCKIWNTKQFPLRIWIYISYLNYCIREAEKGKFSTSLLDNLVERCQRSFSVCPETDILPLFKTLVSTLNSDPNKTHVWDINETEVNNFNSCLNCNETLGTLKISEDEFAKLRKHFLNDVLINKNIHIKTNNEELSEFLSYLKKVKYDVVLDGLNIIHKQNSVLRNLDGGDNVIINIIKYFKKRRMKILFIGRHYLKKYSFFNYIKENCEIFFTQNLSDDDAFLMYAALHGGINTYFFTSDYLRGYSILLNDEEVQVLFRKWNIIRRFSFLPKSYKIVEPKVHSYLPQKTQIRNRIPGKGEMCWHFPVGCDSVKKMTGRKTIWYCLWRKSLDRNPSSDGRFTNRQEMRREKI